MSEAYRVSVGSVVVQLLRDSDAIVRMMEQKDWEVATRGSWQGLTRRDQLVIDVGAYTGIYSIASVLMGCKVLALEPHAGNYRRLVANAAINSVMIDAHQIAASDKDDMRMLRSKKPHDRLSDTASIVREVLKPGEYGEPVLTKRIDQLLDPNERVCLIKLDIEGHEVEALLGAQETIKRHQPNIIVEALDPLAFGLVASTMRLMEYECETKFDGRNWLFVAES